MEEQVLFKHLRNNMRKKHYITLLCLFILLVLPWIFEIDDLIQIENIEKNKSHYDIVEAKIVKVKAVRGHRYVATVQYNHENKMLYKDFQYGIRDADKSTITVAINKSNGEILRTDVAIAYMDISLTFATVCIIAIEFIQYNEEKMKLIIRKAREMNREEG